MSIKNLFKSGSSRDENNLAEEETLETRVNDNEIFEGISVTEKFQDAEYAAYELWKYFSSNGKIMNIGKKLNSFEEEITGKPQMVIADDNTLYPMTAVFEVEIENREYRVKIEQDYQDNLKVEIDCEYDDFQSLSDLLARVRRGNSEENEVIKPRVSVSKTYESTKDLKELFDYLSENSDLSMSGTGFSDLPKLEINEEYGIIPLNAEMEVNLDERNFVFEFNHSGFSGHEVSVETPTDNIEFIDDLLKRFESKKPKDQKGKARSLDFYVDIGDYSWDQVGGLSEVQHELQQYIEWPLQNQELFESQGVKIPKGVLLHGPPGNGKTTIAKILASQSNSVFYSVSPKDIQSMWHGKDSSNWGRLFTYARNDVKEGKSVIIFIDEIDGFFSNRDTMQEINKVAFAQFLQEFDGISDLEGVVTIAATNKYHLLDEALVRPGRLTKKIYIDNPDYGARKEIFNIHTQKKQMAEDVDVEDWAKRTKDYSGAQIEEICNAATYRAIERFSQKRGIAIKDIRGELIEELYVEKQDLDFAYRKISEMSSNSNKMGLVKE